MKPRILVIRLSSLGDIVLTLPVIESLRAAWPEAQIDYLTRKRYIQLVELFPGIDEVISFEGTGRLGSLLPRLRGRYDTVIDLQKNPRSLLLLARLNAEVVTSYPKRRLRRVLLTHWPMLRLRIGHTVDAYLRSLGRLGIKPTTRVPRLMLGAQESQFGFDFIGERRDGEFWVGLCPGAKHPEKRWPGFGALAHLLLADLSVNVIVFSSSGDDVDPCLGISSSRLKVARDLALDRLASVMNQCDVVVSNDSGLMHLAVALGIPVVAIFGPTHPALGFAPLGKHDRIVTAGVHCSPCSLHGEKRCRMPQKYCFDQIDPQRVANEVKELFHVSGRGQILRASCQ